MLAYFYVALALAIRFVPVMMGVPALGFAPIGASLLYFGANRSKKELEIPVLAFCFGDLILNAFFYHFPITWETFVSTGWYAIAVLLGVLLKDKINVLKVAGTSLAGSVSFFFVSNFAVWAAYNMYPKTLAGLGQCYVAAIPFFRNGLATELVYALAFFYLPVAVAAMQKSFAHGSNQAAA